MNTGDTSAIQNREIIRLLQRNELRAARDLSLRVCRSHAGDYQSWLLLGTIQLQLADFAQAEEAYRRALELEPGNPLIPFNIGQALYRQGRYPEAVNHFRQALRLAPGFVPARLSLGRSLRQQGRPDQATACYRKVLDIDPRNAAAWHGLGICVYDDQNPGAAARCFRQAMEMDPRNGLAHCYYGITCDQQGRREEAEACWREAGRLTGVAQYVVEAYRYARACGVPARNYSTSGRVLEFAVSVAPPGGLFLEFGVSFGASITIIANRAGQMVHGFDSFQGLPQSWDVGDTYGAARIEEEGTYSTGGRLPAVPENVRLHVGLFGETLPGFVAEHRGDASFINIDCDLYSSTKTVFEHLGDRIRPGTVLVFDEYFCFAGWREHEYRAFHEFLEQHGLDYEYLAFGFFTGQAVVRITGKQELKPRQDRRQGGADGVQQ